MLKLVALSVMLGMCSASYGYGGGDGGYGGGYHSIELPVKSNHHLEVIPSHSSQEDHQTYVDVPGGVLPVYLTFKTQSSPVYVKQQHRGTKGSYQKSDSHDEPHKLVHEVTKPVYQELREVITPYRKVIQVINPVKEEVLTKVHKGERKSYGGYGGNDGGSDGGYGGNDGGYDMKNDYKQEESYKKSYDDMDNKYGGGGYSGLTLGSYDKQDDYSKGY